MIVVLFDIDGTLITTKGAGQAAMHRVARKTAGSEPSDRRLRFAGRTDRSIINDHFDAYGIEWTPENFSNFCDTFVQRLPTQLAESEGQVLPGITDALTRLQAADHVHLGLLTGNMRKAARIKLDHFGLTEHFLHAGEIVGGFGDLHPDRDDVARDALGEMQTTLGTDIDPTRVWVIGDTPHDVRCARAIGASVLAVATGGYSLDELHATEPDLAVENMLVAHRWWEEVL
ncbi:MAG: HAD hydrolase-like protein [Planctomycetota bacterium]